LNTAHVLVATTLAGHSSSGWALAGGLVGGVAFLAVVYMGRAIGMTRMNFLDVLGTMLVPRASQATVYAVGLMAHLMMSAAFGLAHAGLLHAIGATTVGQAAGWDLLIGAVDGMVILAVMPMLVTLMHPLVRKGAIEPPGVALTGFGRQTPIGSLMAHMVFGLATGAIYAAAIL
jgi:hypothetical protein